MRLVSPLMQLIIAKCQWLIGERLGRATCGRRAASWPTEPIIGPWINRKCQQLTDNATHNRLINAIDLPLNAINNRLMPSVNWFMLLINRKSPELLPNRVDPCAMYYGQAKHKKMRGSSSLFSLMCGYSYGQVQGSMGPFRNLEKYVRWEPRN